MFFSKSDKSVNAKPIGVFDSGVGGLTVYKALKERLPHENFIYLGDTARLPYGTKSLDTVVNYAKLAAQKLMEEQIKLFVVACNTASALALPGVRAWQPRLPCLGVIEPSAAGAVSISQTGRIVVMATEGTIRSGAYQEAIIRHNPEAQIQGMPCNLMVSLVEEGWTSGPEVRSVLMRYINGITLKDYDTVVLGCTHFPLLEDALRSLLPTQVNVLDSAGITAEAVVNYLKGKGLENGSDKPGSEKFMVTDGPERFRHLAERFLGGRAIENIELISF